MMYTLNASGQTPDDGTDLPIWAANADAATRLRIQNRSQSRMQVRVILNDESVLCIELPDFGDLTDESWVDPTLGVVIRSAATGAAFTAVRMV